MVLKSFRALIRGQATTDMMLASIQRGTVPSDLWAEFLGWGEATVSAPQTKGDSAL